MLSPINFLLALSLARIHEHDRLISKMTHDHEAEAKHQKSTGFKPSVEVEKKMRPIHRSVFQNILNRAARPLSRKPVSKKK
jgi:hypothetical protein